MAQPEPNRDIPDIDFSSEALRAIEALDEDVQKQIAASFTAHWSWGLSFLSRIAFQSYLHISEFQALSHLSRETTLLVIAGYVAHVRIDPRTYTWYVVRFDTRPASTWCRVHEVPKLPQLPEK